MTSMIIKLLIMRFMSAPTIVKLGFVLPVIGIVLIFATTLPKGHKNSKYNIKETIFSFGIAATIVGILFIGLTVLASFNH